MEINYSSCDEHTIQRKGKRTDYLLRQTIGSQELHEASQLLCSRGRGFATGELAAFIEELAPPLQGGR